MESDLESSCDVNLPESRVRCTRLQSIPEICDPDDWSPCSSPTPERACVHQIRSRSLPGSVALELPIRGSRRLSETEKCGITESRLLVLGYTGVGKSALVVRYLTKRFIGDYAPYETVSTTTINSTNTKVTILDMSWQTHSLDDVKRYLDWCNGIMLVFSLVSLTSFREVETLCRHLQSKLRRTPSVLVGTKSDLNHAREVTQPEISQFATTMKCLYVETSARENLASCVQAFATLMQETKLNEKKNQKNGAKNGYSSKIQNIRQRLLSIAGEFRQRTNTF